MLLTGCSPFRIGAGPEASRQHGSKETSRDEALRAHGYPTAVSGKWHNGEALDVSEYRGVFEEACKAMLHEQLPGGFGVNEHGSDKAGVYHGGGGDYFTRRTGQGRGPVRWPSDTDYHQDVGRQGRDHREYCGISMPKQGASIPGAADAVLARGRRHCRVHTRVEALPTRGDVRSRPGRMSRAATDHRS